MKVVVHQNAQTIWTTNASKLFRSSPEHVRPVAASEAREIPMIPNSPSVSIIAQQFPRNADQGITRVINNSPDPPNIPNPVSNPQHNLAANNPITNDSISGGQPDGEPEAPASQHTTSPTGGRITETMDEQPQVIHDPAVETPVPVEEDDDLVCEGLLCHDEDPCMFTEAHDLAWRFEVNVGEQEYQQWQSEENNSDMIFLVSAAKKQRAEVKLFTLNAAEKAEFQKAKCRDIDNWIKTGTISKILRDQIPYDQILRCRWILTWKDVEPDAAHAIKVSGKPVKAKARLVILGYLDPKLENLPRDSPTLGRNSKMILLQLIASMGWMLRSFDIQAAFLQGKPQSNRILAVEPVPELIEALRLKTNEVCKLEKGAYGLVDAPYMWFMAISEELLKLGFIQSPFDPCLFVFKNPKAGNLEGVLGLHVDDGICGGSSFFQEKLDQLETKYPFGSKKIQQFTFIGIEMQQLPDYSIHMSQSKYVRSKF